MDTHVNDTKRWHSDRIIQARKKHAQAVQLRENGATLQQIADALGYKAQSSASRAIEAYLARQSSAHRREENQMDKNLEDRGALTLKEACEYLGGISRPTMYTLLGEGKVISFKIGTRRYFRRETLDNYMKHAESLFVDPLLYGS
jgi:excisionase family DNA binding protein